VWATGLRPSRSYDDEFGSITYAITHLIYTQNDYGMYRLSPDAMPQEFDFLRANIGVRTFPRTGAKTKPETRRQRRNESEETEENKRF